MHKIDSSDIKPLFTAKLQKMMEDVIGKSSNHSLSFRDETFHRQQTGRPFLKGDRACIFIGNSGSIICINNFQKFISRKQPKEDAFEISIAHELGHLLLHLLDFSITIKSSDDVRVELYNIMQHAVFFPLIKTVYHFDLHREANRRLDELLGKNYFRSNRDFALDYIRYQVEADNAVALDQMDKSVRKSLKRQTKEINPMVIEVISAIKALSYDKPDPDAFKRSYSDILVKLGLSDL